MKLAQGELVGPCAQAQSQGLTPAIMTGRGGGDLPPNLLHVCGVMENIVVISVSSAPPPPHPPTTTTTTTLKAQTGRRIVLVLGKWSTCRCMANTLQEPPRGGVSDGSVSGSATSG